MRIIIYNKAIKKAFELAELDRTVTVLDPLTNEEVKSHCIKLPVAIWPAKHLLEISIRE